MQPKLIAGNWKMHGTRASARSLAEDVARTVGSGRPGVEVVVFPPFVHLTETLDAVRETAVAVGAQDCHAAHQGAHTGNISAPMLADLGCRWVIVGHSERRADHQEDDATVKAKAEAVLAAGLGVILCVGESLNTREAGQAEAAVSAQLSASLPLKSGPLAIAYEPVWAIGTGKVPTVAEIATMHRALHAILSRNRPDTRVLYGGSVNAANAREILAIEGVDGVLVGGASLNAESFTAIVGSAG